MFGGHGRTPGAFEFPVGIARAADGNLLVSEYGGNDRVQEFTPTGAFVRAFGSFGTAPGAFQRPQSLVVAGDRVLVCDAMNDRVQEFRRDGSFVGVWSVALRTPYGLAAHGDGFALIEYGAQRVTLTDAAGAERVRLCAPGRGERQLATPWGLAGVGDALWLCDTGNRRLAEWRP
jgi:DNA-binding beta-propeller fold protein YncE